MAGDWRINADERIKYDSYFQQCSPMQGYVTGEQARNFFVQSGLPGDILRKIWDLSDLTSDGRLDKREFSIACHLISSQVQKKVPLPPTLPPTLLSEAITIITNGAAPPMPSLPLTITRPFSYRSAPGQPVISGQQLLKPAVVPSAPLTATNRSKYLQQFHSLVDVSKTNGFMGGLQAKNILQQTGLSQTLLHQIWTLADHDKDGRLTSDEFVIAMHCCDIVRTGQTLPSRLPDEWLPTTTMQHERPSLLAKPNVSQAFANLNQDLKDAFKVPIATERYSPDTVEIERRNSLVTYEDKRQKNYEDGYKELERRRQLLHEQEERDQREREDRERKREAELQKQKDDQERKKQMDFERQLERQRQIEHHKEEERKKLFEQRETARKEMERRSRLEWEHQRMQELSTQKFRLLEQINDLKSREKALGLELQSMDDTMQTNQTKVHQTNTNVQLTDQSINDIQKRTIQEKHLLETVEQQRKDLIMKLNHLRTERESLGSSVKHLNQSKEFSMGSRESDQMRFAQMQLENTKQESTRVDEQITSMNNQCKQYQNQMEHLRRQLSQFEQDARTKKPPSTATSPTPFPNYDQFRASNDFKAQSSSSPIAPPAAIDVDPFQTVDPFASQSDIGSPTTLTNNDWFQPSNNGTTINDPFLSKTEIPPKNKNPAPRVSNKQTPAADPWGGSAATNKGNSWAPFNSTSSPFGTTNEWPQTPPTVSNGNSSSGTNQYRAVYDYKPERSDEVALSIGDIITVDLTQQQDANWLFGKIGNDKQGFFPAAYAEPIPSTPSSANGNVFDTSSQLTSGSWAISLADCQGKTTDKHLSFQKGEFILVREKKDASWYSGQLNGKVGWFPRNYVRPATEVEIQNNKNTAKNTSMNEKPLNSPMSPNGTSSNENNFAWRQAPTVPAIPDVYEAIYPYEGTETTDLSFNVGERIIVLKREGDWWTGKIGDRTGTFPYNYVQKPLQETAIAIAPFHTNEEGRLSFEQGQVIYIRKKGDKGWYQGETRGSDQPIRVGWFPANCVQLQTISTPTTPVATYLNTAELPRYVAIFPYEAQQEDELSFPADAILEILEEAGNSGWFKARYGTQTGLIPSTYVKPIAEHNQSSSTKSRLPPRTHNASRHSITITVPSDNDTSSLPPNLSSNPTRISAIRELIDTEQRYVEDLLIVANEFIKPLNNARILNDHEIEQLFINWYNLIALNSNLLRALQEQVDYKEQNSPLENEVILRAPRSVSMTNIALAAQLPTKSIINDRHRSFTPDASHSPSVRRLKHRSGTHHRSPSSHGLAAKPNIEFMNDNLTSQSHIPTSGSMTIDESTKIGDILCFHLPTMANDYFQYCNYRSQANKAMQIKIDSNEQFRSFLKIFQDKTGGLSLNGFLTKPIQRVTRYPLLIEKVLKHTPTNHFDYQSIKRALDCARQLNERINKKISEQESSSRLDWLQQHLTFGSDENSSDGYLSDELLKFNSVNKYHLQRQLLLHGLVTKVPSGKELLAFLFNDFLLFSTMKSSSSNWQTQLFEPKSSLQLKLYRLPLFLTDIIIANDSLNDQFTFTITTKIYEKPLVLKIQQTNVRTLWVKAINNAVEDCQAAEKSILADKAVFTVTENKRDSKAAVARLLLVVQEAHDILPSPATLERHRSIDPYCEITIGPLTLKTPFVKRTTNPKWNAPMQFLLYNLVEDNIHINLFDNEYFSPNENLGYTSIHLVDILPCSLDTFLTQPSLPFTQRIYLNNGSSVVIKCVVQHLTS